MRDGRGSKVSIPYVGKYGCERCGWEGDNPIRIEGEEDFYLACPRGCKWLSNEEPVPVLLNPNHPENEERVTRALYEAELGIDHWNDL
jgi:hypothetical protein